MAELLKYGVVTALGGAIVYANLPTRWTLGNIVPTVQYLRDTELRRIEAGNKLNKPEKASNLFAQGPVLVIAFRRLGCLFCRVGAHDVTQLKPELDKAGVRLVGIVHQTIGVDEFLPYFKGELYLDDEARFIFKIMLSAARRFFGPNERWMPLWMGFLRPRTYVKLFQGWRRGIKAGELSAGEGRLLGGFFLINKDQMIYSHLEREWSDSPEPSELLEAIRKLNDGQRLHVD
ncbi:unnamed protein product [Toxocara canis]|uniref:Peroxiredoxin-like 2A n=1 Tax=Toxocara canis TaxID=6265 RepID=A0A183TVN6_TOXCA|nr:unnamed protein product [Toxocara canis]